MITLNFETGENLEIDKSTLCNSVLSGFDFHRAIFDGMNLGAVDFRESELRGTSLRNVKAGSANFSLVSLMTSDFYQAELRGAKFINSKAMYSDFSSADLSQADMTGADVMGAVFKGAELSGAVMLCQGLEKAELDGAVYNSATIWPDGFDPLSMGAVSVSS